VSVTEAAEDEGKLFWFAAAGPQARRHFESSLREGVPLGALRSLGPKFLSNLPRHTHDGRVRAWGARPGSAAEKKWLRLEPGDVALVYADGRFPLWGKVVAKTRNTRVARQIWGRDEKGETWALMFFLDPVEPCDVDLERFVRELGYKDNYMPRGFEIAGAEAQARIRHRYGSAEAFARSASRPSAARPVASRPPAASRPSAARPVASPAPLADRVELADVEGAVGDRDLDLAPSVVPRVVAALNSGKHLILTGPPGTAKTTLALAVAAAAQQGGASRGTVVTTATSDWTTFETIGGLRPGQDGTLDFVAGQFVTAIENDKWLLVDELNRSNFDRAFGQLFTVLSGQPVVLPWSRGPLPLALVPAAADGQLEDVDIIRVAPSWRLIATMNVFDKALLFEMSYALMRRFAFVEVPSPGDDVFGKLIGRAAEGDDAAADIATRLLAVRAVKDIGPASFIDIARYARERLRDGLVPSSALLLEAFYSFLLPQFEGIADDAGQQLFDAVARLLVPGDRDALSAALTSVIGVELRPAGGAEDAAA
jgi:MoxR-like ATPase